MRECLDENSISAESDAQRQLKALHDLYAGLKAVDDEPADNVIDAILGHRFNIGRKLDL
jgi:hypothetical protein